MSKVSEGGEIISAVIGHWEEPVLPGAGKKEARFLPAPLFYLKACRKNHCHNFKTPLIASKNISIKWRKVYINSAEYDPVTS